MVERLMQLHNYRYGKALTMEVGLRVASQRFSKNIKAVRGGEVVLLTDRGKPLARIVPIHIAEQLETLVHRLEAMGFLRAAAKPHPMPAWNPRPLTGVPMTRTLREERESS
jgi:prevent-host-death family protein